MRKGHGNQQANDLLMCAPADVSPKQLREPSIRVMAEPRKQESGGAAQIKRCGGAAQVKNVPEKK